MQDLQVSGSGGGGCLLFGFYNIVTLVQVHHWPLEPLYYIYFCIQDEVLQSDRATEPVNGNQRLISARKGLSVYCECVCSLSYNHYPNPPSKDPSLTNGLWSQPNTSSFNVELTRRRAGIHNISQHLPQNWECPSLGIKRGENDSVLRKCEIYCTAGRGSVRLWR